MNTAGLLYKGNYSTIDLSSPQLLYQMPANAYMGLVSIYLVTTPGNNINGTVYACNQIIAPSEDDSIYGFTGLGNAQSTIILPNVELSNNDCVYLSASGTGNITIQIRGLTQLLMPSFVLNVNN